jgi:hypothetical protein
MEQERKRILLWCKSLVTEAQELCDDLEALDPHASEEDINTLLAHGIMRLEHGIRHIREERADDLKW